MRTLALMMICVSLTADAASVPRPSPELILQRGNAAPIQLSRMRGKVVALAFINTTCSHCQDLTRLLKVIQKDYAARNVQVVACAIDDTAAINYPMYLKAFEPNFPAGYTKDTAAKQFLQWNDKTDGMMMVPYMVFIDARGTVRGDFNGKDGFFGESDKNIRAQLDKMLKSSTPAAREK
jgi:thiol-disulfide isomerase/thioredoxin